MASFYIRLPLETTTGGGTTSNVNVVSSALPSGASTAAKQDVISGKLDTVISELGAVNSELDSQTTVLNFIDAELGTIAANTAKGSLKNYYSEVVAVAVGVSTILVSKTVSVASKLKSVHFSGTNWGEFTVLVNGSLIDKARTNVSGPLNSGSEFGDGLALVSGDLVQVSVVNSRTSAGDYNARLLIEEFI